MSNESEERVVRSEGNGVRMAAAPDPFAGQGGPRPTESIAPAPAPRIAPARMKRTHAIEIPTAILRQLVIKHIAETPEVLIDLMNRADVHFLDAADNEVPIDSCAITWEE